MLLRETGLGGQNKARKPSPGRWVIDEAIPYIFAVSVCRRYAPQHLKTSDSDTYSCRENVSEQNGQSHSDAWRLPTCLSGIAFQLMHSTTKMACPTLSQIPWLCDKENTHFFFSIDIVAHSEFGNIFIALHLIYEVFKSV